MKLKFGLINPRITALSLSLLAINAGPALAATIALNGGTGTSCSYTAYSADSSGNMQVTCDTGSGTGTSPVCTLTASPSTIISGASSQLTANCTGSPTSYAWTGSGTANFTSSTSSSPVSTTSTATYTVVGTNSLGSSNPASTVVTVGVVTPPPPPPTGDCTIVDVTWSPGFKFGVTPVHAMQAGKMMAFRMTVPANKRVAQAGTAYADVAETLSISSTACDFSAALERTSCLTSGDNDPVMYNGPGTGGYCGTPVGSVIYYNVKHSPLPNGAEGCAAGTLCKFSLWW